MARAFLGPRAVCGSRAANGARCRPKQFASHAQTDARKREGTFHAGSPCPPYSTVPPTRTDGANAFSAGTGKAVYSIFLSLLVVGLLAHHCAACMRGDIIFNLAFRKTAG